MIPWLGPGIYTLKYRAFPVDTEFSVDFLCEKNTKWHSVGSNSPPLDDWT